MRAAALSGWRTIPRAAEGLRRAASMLLRPRRVTSPAARRRRVALAVLLLAVLAPTLGATYMLWFRDSSFVSVQRVSITGLHGVNAARERSAVMAAAKRMTTLHYDEAALRRALDAGLTIETVRVTADFPHGLRVEVVEKAAVAVLVHGSVRVTVGSGGVFLRDVQPALGSLPAIDAGPLPPRARLGDARALRLVAAAAAAPAALRPRLLRLRELPGKGLVADLRSGPEVILGSASDLPAKWTAAAAILADGTSRGATYIDVRLPDRPVAGGLHVVPPPTYQQPGQASTQPATGATAPASGAAAGQTSPPTGAPAAASGATPATGATATGAGTTGTGTTAGGTATGTGTGGAGPTTGAGP